jgi:phospholipid/cholesterol/gamma-HCH transport system substrate-binding protein
LQGTIETKVGIFVLAAIGVFIYMGFQIGAFRFDRGRYVEYTMYFKDITGLSRKADIKIAGVKVGWVENIQLAVDGDLLPKATAMILREYTLYSDAYAIVRQDGLLGPHYIELIPGDPLLSRLNPGSTLGRPSIAPVSVDELLHQFKKIATNVESVTESFRAAVGGVEGQDKMRSFFDNLERTAEKMSAFSEVLERSFVRNESNIDKFLEIGVNVQRLSDRLDREIFPSFQEGIEKISNAFDRDFDRIANRLEATADAVAQVSSQAQEGMRSLSSVAEKIDDGKGLIGRLINDDETYYDLKLSLQGLKNYMTKLDRLQFVFDGHWEMMARIAENYYIEDAKGYVDVRIHPNEDHFYLIQFASSEKGFVYRKEVEKNYTDAQNNIVTPSSLPETIHPVNGNGFFSHIFNEQKSTYKRNTLKIGLQFGKIFHDIALRVGLFEGSAGAGVDVDIPFGTDKFRWVTTFEAFDFRGWNRRDDRRPHLKWLNKIFVLRSLYLTFGADDFASRHNASTFIGGGLRFGDDDVKYLLSSVGSAGGSLSAFE